MKWTNGSTTAVPGLDEWFTSIPALALTHFGCDRAGVALRGTNGGVVTLSASDDLAEVADRLQERLADGPAWSPVWPAAQLAVHDTDRPTHWPSWSSAVADLGVTSVLATQVVTTEGLRGAFTLYYSRPVVVTVQDLALAKAVANHVATEVHHALMAARLTTALDARTRIGQAQGILMERFGLAADEALSVLERQSQATSTKLNEVAGFLIARDHRDAHLVDDQPMSSGTDRSSLPPPA